MILTEALVVISGQKFQALLFNAITILLPLKEYAIGIFPSIRFGKVSKYVLAHHQG